MASPTCERLAEAEDQRCRHSGVPLTGEAAREGDLRPTQRDPSRQASLEELERLQR